MAAAAHDARRHIPGDARRESRDVVAKCPQRGTEEQVVLETPPASAIPNQFLLDGADVETHRPAQQRIQVLKGNRARVEQRELLQGCQIRGPACWPVPPIEGYARQVGVEV